MFRISLLPLTLGVTLSVSAITQDSLKLYEGTILDQNDKPLTGVVVYIEGTETGGVSDWNGNFSIDISKEFKTSDTLKILTSYVGYITQSRLITAADLNAGTEIILVENPNGFKGGVIGRRRSPFARIKNGIKKLFHKKE